MASLEKPGTESATSIRQRIWNERRRLLSFGLIGVGSLILSVGLYGLFSRIVWPTGPHTLEYTLVMMLVTWLNYEANRFFYV